MNLPSAEVATMAYHKLSSEKYWLESYAREQADLLRQQPHSRIKNLTINGITLILMVGAVAIAVQTMPEWLPTVATFLRWR